MAQKRRKDMQMKRKQRQITALCIAGGIGAVALSLVICLMIFDIRPASAPVSAPRATALPYSAAQPFTLSDLTSAQIAQLREKGRMTVSDGPRGVSVGDTLDTLLARFPTGNAQADRTTSGAAQLPSAQAAPSDEETLRYVEQHLSDQSEFQPEQTGEQSDEETVLYCAKTFINQNGALTALPPRGLLTVDTGAIIVTLLAPTSAYPEGTLDSYGHYEHVYCIFTLSPDTMTIKSITLGIDG